MSPFRTSLDFPAYQDRPAPAAPGIETLPPASRDEAEPSRAPSHWWQRLGRKRATAASAP